MDDPRFRSQRSPRDEAPGTMSLVTPPRNGTTRLPHPSFSAQAQQQASAADSRSSLHRRFTTDSGRVPTLNSMSLTSPTRDYPQRDMAQHADFPQRGAEQDFNNNQAYHKVQLVRKSHRSAEAGSPLFVSSAQRATRSHPALVFPFWPVLVGGRNCIKRIATNSRAIA
jgi:hypothetical protein